MVIWAISGYAYLVDQNNSGDIQGEKNYTLGGVLLSGITWPILLLVGLVTSIVKAFLFGIFIVFFSVLLIIGQVIFLLPWLEETSLPTGTKLLEVNSFLSKIFSKDS